MESHWDLDSVLEQCCSKLHNEDLLPPFGNTGDFGWLDEKVDLSAWTELDLPDELARGTLGVEPPSAHPTLFFDPKLRSQLPPESATSRSSSWSGDHFSPAFPSPPESPLNSSPFVAPERSQLEEFQLSFGDAFVEDAISASPQLSPILSPGTASSPPPTPVCNDEPESNVLALARHDHRLVFDFNAPSQANTYDTRLSPSLFPPALSQQNVSSRQTLAASPSTTPSVSSTADCTGSKGVPSALCLVPTEELVVVPQVSPPSPVREHSEKESDDVDTSDVEFVIIENGPASNECGLVSEDTSEDECVADDVTDDSCCVASVVEVEVEVTTEDDERPRKRKRRASQRVGRESLRKERKRLQNKDAATRYRQKKKRESENITSEYDAQCEINRRLKGEVEKVSNEISYLKGLMRELFRARGLLK